MSSIDDNVIIELDNVQKELLLTNLDEDGKLSCLKAFKVAVNSINNVIDCSTFTFKFPFNTSDILGIYVIASSGLFCSHNK